MLLGLTGVYSCFTEMEHARDDDHVDGLHDGLVRMTHSTHEHLQRQLEYKVLSLQLHQESFMRKM